MSNLIIGTNAVSMDEPCLGLSEKDEQSTDSRGFHRYLCIKVMRNGSPVLFQKDLGLSKRFKGNPFYIPGGVIDETGHVYIEHTVGELMDIAEQIRKKPSFNQNELSKVNKFKK